MSEDLYQRTVEDSKIVINHAKLNEEDLLPVTQAIYLSNSMKDYKLLEISNDLLNEIKEGNRVVFRGDTDDRPVLCTNNKTFEVKEAETSNCLNLIPNLMFPDHPDMKKEYEDRNLVRKNIEGIYYSYLELKLCKPRFTKLTKILKESMYVDDIIERTCAEGNDTRELYTFDRLLDVIQSSKQELIEQLEQRNAGEINGFIRILQHDFNFKMLSHILNFIDSNSWSVDEIDYSETKSALSSLFKEEIFEFIFRIYTKLSDKQNEQGDQLYCLVEDKVCRTLGEALLIPAGKIVLDEFMNLWKISVPEGLQINLKQLEGIAFVKKNSRPVSIQYFPEIDLSEDIKERIDQLFQVQERWTLDDIKPYIECLASEKLNVNALLTKYARASNENGVRYFSSRLGR